MKRKGTNRMGKIKMLLKEWRIWLLIFALVLAIVAINPHPFREGVSIRAVAKDSPAHLANITPPLPNTMPIDREVITEINSMQVKNIDDYYSIVSTLKENQSILIKTNKAEYFIPKIEYRNGEPYLGLSVYDAPKTNLKFGLDLEGGTRAIIRPIPNIEGNQSSDNSSLVSQEDLDLVIENLRQRLNAFGLSDIVVRSARDLEGENFIIVEVAGANDEDVRQLISQQGKFEAKIGNTTVFRGGNEDITSVCRTSQCSYAVDPQKGCSKISADEYMCTFSFQITLSEEAAQRFAEATKDLQIIQSQGGAQSYLNETIDFYLDDELVDSLNIAGDLRGVPATTVSISGPGYGKTREEAVEASRKNMESLRTIISTGSLPLKIEIIKMDSLSPMLGREFLVNSIQIGLVAVIVVVLMLFLRYKTPHIILPIIIVMISELVITLGIAAAFNWNLDLAAIGGLIIAIGSGIDDQIVISDEILKGSRKEKYVNWKKRFSNAFFIVLGAFFTTAVAMIPLFFAGAGLLRGFAFTTLVGISVGVLITRPAFAKMLEIISRD